LLIFALPSVTRYQWKSSYLQLSMLTGFSSIEAENLS